MLGPYALIDRFAVGGAAELYRAKDTRNGNLVAIKRVRPDLPFDPEVSAGFLREIQLALGSQHPNLVQGFDSGSIDGLDYVVLEYIQGKDLEHVRRRVKKARVDVPARFWLFIVRELLAGLHFAHEMSDATGEILGLVHRDVNPRNVLIDFLGRVKLADFGAAVATFQEPTPAEVVGSVGYMAPEQANLHSIDRRSDIFAVGCILYELLVGERPFDIEGKRDAHVLRAHQRGIVRPVPDHLEEPLRLIIEIATSPDPEDRYRDAATMRDAVDAALGELDHERYRSLLAAGMRQLFPDEWTAFQALAR